MKPFSINSEGTQICLYNFKLRSSVNSAPMKHQCAKDYFYGADGELEKAFQPTESHYASTVRDLTGNHEAQLTDDQLIFLRDFALLQSLRTDAAAKRFALMHNELYEMMTKKNPKVLAELALDKQSIIELNLANYSAFRRTISDLKTCIIVNETNTDFVTSDDPAIHTNRFHLQRVKSKTFGIGSAGTLLLMPLSPKHTLLSYDPHVYITPSIVGSTIRTTDVADIEALNSLQYIRTNTNIFFRNWATRQYIADQAGMMIDHRPDTWWRIHFLVPDGGSSRIGRYRGATEEEVLSAKKFVTHYQAIFPEPPTWFSKLKWHPKPRFNNTGTGAGIIRPGARFED